VEGESGCASVQAGMAPFLCNVKQQLHKPSDRDCTAWRRASGASCSLLASHAIGPAPSPYHPFSRKTQSFGAPSAVGPARERLRAPVGVLGFHSSERRHHLDPRGTQHHGQEASLRSFGIKESPLISPATAHCAPRFSRMLKFLCAMKSHGRAGRTSECDPLQSEAQ